MPRRGGAAGDPVGVPDHAGQTTANLSLDLLIA